MDRSMDRKVTTLARWEKNAKRWKPIVKNAFGTLAGVTCPGATDWCYSDTGAQCYAVKRGENLYPNTKALVTRNTLALEGADYDTKVSLYNQTIVEFKADHEKAQKKAPWELPKVFRWFWDGDVRTKEDARAIRAVCNLHPDVQFWQYTRSFEFVPFLVGPSNLVVYLSVDRYNVTGAIDLRDRVPDLRFAFCGDTWEETEELAYKVTGRNAPKCPELTHHYDLVVDKGDGWGQGACVECGLCIKGVNNVRFSS